MSVHLENSRVLREPLRGWGFQDGEVGGLVLGFCRVLQSLNRSSQISQIPPYFGTVTTTVTVEPTHGKLKKWCPQWSINLGKEINKLDSKGDTTMKFENYISLDWAQTQYGYRTFYKTFQGNLDD